MSPAGFHLLLLLFTTVVVASVSGNPVLISKGRQRQPKQMDFRMNPDGSVSGSVAAGESFSNPLASGALGFSQNFKMGGPKSLAEFSEAHSTSLNTPLFSFSNSGSLSSVIGFLGSALASAVANAFTSGSSSGASSGASLLGGGDSGFIRRPLGGLFGGGRGRRPSFNRFREAPLFRHKFNPRFPNDY